MVAKKLWVRPVGARLPSENVTAPGERDLRQNVKPRHEITPAHLAPVSHLSKRRKERRQRY